MRFIVFILAGAALLGLAGCGKPPAETREFTEEEERKIEADLRRRVELEGEGSSRRAQQTEKDDEAPPTPPMKTKR